MRLFSKIAYHSTRQKGLRQFDNFTGDDKAKTGEGAMVHGWGLYLQLDQKSNRECYLLPFAEMDNTSDRYVVNIDGVNFYGEKTEDMVGVVGPDSFAGDSVDIYDWYVSEDFKDSTGLSNADYLMLDFLLMWTLDGVKDTVNTLIDEYDYYNSEEESDDWVYDNYDEDSPEIYRYLSLNELEQIRDKLNRMNNVSTKEFVEKENDNLRDDGTEFEKASQYEVEIPDNMVFMNEDEYCNFNPLYEIAINEFDIGDAKYKEYEQKALKELTVKFPDFKYDYEDDNVRNIFEEAANGWFNMIITGIGCYNGNNNCNIDKYDFVDEIKNLLQKYPVLQQKHPYDLKIVTNGQLYSTIAGKIGQKQTSEWFMNHGIDGIEYDGSRDDLCYVIFNCSKLKIVAER